MNKVKPIISLAFVLTTLFFTFQPCIAKSKEKPITVVIPSYNNKDWYQANLDTLFSQKYKKYKVIYIDDVSSDGTGDLVEEYVKQHGQQHRFTLIRNKERRGALYNIYHAVHSCDDNDIVLLYDGDDWFPNENVFKIINKNYRKKNIWLTHGTLVEYPNGRTDWCIPIPDHIVKTNAFRTYRCPSHLRTFYAWLFKKIKLEDLMYDDVFFAMTWDQALLFPMFEMAGERHKFIKEVVYVYNVYNPINDNKVDPQLQNDLEKHIRGMPPYKRLKNKKDQPN